MPTNIEVLSHSIREITFTIYRTVDELNSGIHHLLVRERKERPKAPELTAKHVRKKSKRKR